MKRIFFGVVFVLLFTELVCAQVNLDSGREDLQNKTEGFLTKSVELSGELNKFVRFAFGLDEETDLNMQTFIFIVVLVVLTLFTFRDISLMFSSFTKLSSWAGAVALTVALSVFRVFGFLLEKSLVLGDLFSFVEDNSVMVFGFSLVVILSFFAVLNLLLIAIRRTVVRQRKEEDGLMAGLMLKKLSTMDEAYNYFKLR